MPCAEYRVAAADYYAMAYYRPIDRELAENPTDCRANSRNTVGMYSPLPYLASAVGMRVAEFLGVIPEVKLIAGRAANVIATSIVGLVALMMVGHRGAVLVFVMLIPESFWLRSALSGDAMTISLCVYFLAYVVRLSKLKRPLLRREILILVALGSLVGLTKVVYGVLCFSSVLIWQWDRKYIRASLLSLLVLLMPGTVAVAVAGVWMQLVAPDLVFLGFGAKPMMQAQEILSAPGHFLHILFETLRNKIGDQIYNFFVPSVWVPIPVGQVVSGLLAVSYFVAGAISFPVFTGVRRVLLVILSAFVLVIVVIPAYLTYTPVGHGEIWGIQGRYFIPVAALFGLSLGLRRSICVTHRCQKICLIVLAAYLLSINALFALLYLN